MYDWSRVQYAINRVTQEFDGCAREGKIKSGTEHK